MNECARGTIHFAEAIVAITGTLRPITLVAASLQIQFRKCLDRPLQTRLLRNSNLLLRLLPGLHRQQDKHMQIWNANEFTFADKADGLMFTRRWAFIEIPLYFYGLN